MEERQSFEKARNIEASILKKKYGSEAQQRAAPVGVRSKTVCRTKKIRLGAGFRPPFSGDANTTNSRSTQDLFERLG